jgi:uncharacterized protein YeaO (DUF488 family)
MVRSRLPSPRKSADARTRTRRPAVGSRRRTAAKARTAVVPGATHQHGARATTVGPTRVAAKRIYEAPVAADGTRVLTMRYWPRGIRKEKVDLWLRELAPAIPLLRAYLDGRITWAQYAPRYLAGLERPEAQAALAELRALARRGPVTVLCGCADPERCHRTLLQRHLLEPAG